MTSEVTDPLTGTVTGGELRIERAVSRRTVVETLLGGPPHRLPALGYLLDAVSSALAGGLPVALVSADPDEAAVWVAAVSFLAGPDIARRVELTVPARLADLVPDRAGVPLHVVDPVELDGLLPGDRMEPGAPLNARIVEAGAEARRLDTPDGPVWENRFGQRVPVTEWSTLALEACAYGTSGLLGRLTELSRVCRMVEPLVPPGPLWPLAVVHLLRPASRECRRLAARVVLRDTPAETLIPDGLLRPLSPAFLECLGARAADVWALLRYADWPDVVDRSPLSDGSLLPDRSLALTPSEDPSRGAGGEPGRGGKLVELALVRYFELAVRDEAWLLRPGGVPLPRPLPVSREISPRLRGFGQAALQRLQEGDPAPGALVPPRVDVAGNWPVERDQSAEHVHDTRATHDGGHVSDPAHLHGAPPAEARPATGSLPVVSGPHTPAAGTPATASYPPGGSSPGAADARAAAEQPEGEHLTTLLPEAPDRPEAAGGLAGISHTVDAAYPAPVCEGGVPGASGHASVHTPVPASVHTPVPAPPSMIDLATADRRPVDTGAQPVTFPGEHPAAQHPVVQHPAVQHPAVQRLAGGLAGGPRLPDPESARALLVPHEQEPRHVRLAARSLRLVDILVRMEDVVRGSVVTLKDALALMEQVADTLMDSSGPRVVALVGRLHERTLTYLVWPPVRRRLEELSGLPGQRLDPSLVEMLVPLTDLHRLASRSESGVDRDPILAEAVVARCLRSVETDPELRVAAALTLLRPGAAWPTDRTSRECAREALAMVRGREPWHPAELRRLVESAGPGLDVGLARHLMAVLLDAPSTEDGRVTLALLRQARGIARGTVDGQETLADDETAMLDVMAQVGPAWYLEEGGFPARAIDILGVVASVWDRLADQDRPRVAAHLLVSGTQVTLACDQVASGSLGARLRERCPRQPAALVRVAYGAVDVGLESALPLFAELIGEGGHEDFRRALARHCLREALDDIPAEASLTRAVLPTDLSNRLRARDVGQAVLRYGLRELPRTDVQELFTSIQQDLGTGGQPLGWTQRLMLRRWWRSVLPQRAAAGH